MKKNINFILVSRTRTLLLYKAIGELSSSHYHLVWFIAISDGDMTVLELLIKRIYIECLPRKKCKPNNLPTI